MQYAEYEQQMHSNSYLTSSPHVQQPLPASTMASSVAALQRLSASIDVTPVSRSNSRASAAYENTSENTKENSEKSPTAPEQDGGRPQFLTANCVVYSFYSGDLANAIDDHFNRALKTDRDSPNHSESAKQPSGM